MKLLPTLALSLAMTMALPLVASAQVITTEKGKQSDATMINIHRIELLNSLLPLFLTKEQINGKLLPAIEKARSQWKELLTQEDEILAKLDPQINEVIANGIDKQRYPPKDFLTEIQSKTRSMGLKRTILQIQLVGELDNVVKECLDTGQLKALIGSFDARYIDPATKPEEMKEDTKRQFFVRNVFMDPLARELLIQIAAKIPDEAPKTGG